MYVLYEVKFMIRKTYPAFKWFLQFKNSDGKIVDLKTITKNGIIVNSVVVEQSRRIISIQVL